MIDLFERASVQNQRSIHPHMGDWSFGGRSADIVNPMRIAKRWNPGLATSTLRPHAKEKKRKKEKKGLALRIYATKRSVNPLFNLVAPPGN